MVTYYYYYFYYIHIIKKCNFLINEYLLFLGILPKGIYFENMPITAQALHHIKNSGPSGLSHQDLAQKMGLTKHFIRGLINKLYSEKHIQFYFENDGRKRSKRFVFFFLEINDCHYLVF